MNNILLDFTGCKSPLELHLIIKYTFGFPDFMEIICLHYGIAYGNIVLLTQSFM